MNAGFHTHSNETRLKFFRFSTHVSRGVNSTDRFARRRRKNNNTKMVGGSDAGAISRESGSIQDGRVKSLKLR